MPPSFARRDCGGIERKFVRDIPPYVADRVVVGFVFVGRGHMLENRVEESPEREGELGCPVCGRGHGHEYWGYWGLVRAVVPLGRDPVERFVPRRLERRIDEHDRVAEAQDRIIGATVHVGCEPFDECFGNGIEQDRRSETMPDENHTHLAASGMLAACRVIAICEALQRIEPREQFPRRSLRHVLRRELVRSKTQREEGLTDSHRSSAPCNIDTDHAAGLDAEAQFVGSRRPSSPRGACHGNCAHWRHPRRCCASSRARRRQD